MSAVGVIGHRSWIAGVLIDCIQSTTDHEVRLVSKGDPARHPDLRCLFIIPGRLSQSSEEMAHEREMVFHVANSPLTCHKQVLLSSLACEDRSTQYGEHKWRVEQAFFDGAALRMSSHRQWNMEPIAIRTPAVFGLTQDPASPMLIPSIAREGESLQLRTPDRPTRFISAYDLADHLVGLIDANRPSEWPHKHAGEPLVGMSVRDIPGTFTLTPEQLMELWRTWKSLST